MKKKIIFALDSIKNATINQIAMFLISNTIFFTSQNYNSKRNINKVYYADSTKIVFVTLIIHCTLASCVAIQVSNLEKDITKIAPSNNLESLTVDEIAFENTTTNRYKRSSNNSTKSRNTDLLDNMIKLRKEIERTTWLTFIDSDENKRLYVMDNVVQLLRSSLSGGDEIMMLLGKKNKAEFIAKASRAVDDFNVELITIKNKIQNRELRNRSLEECIKEIEAHLFVVASEKFMNFTDNEINDIIKKVYNHQSTNSSDLLLEFLEHVTEISTKFQIYTRLFHEIKENGHDDPYRLLKLLRNLINAQPIYSETEYNTQAHRIMNELMNRMKTATKKLLQEAISKNRHDSIDDLMDQLFSVHSRLLKEIVTDVVQNFIVSGKPNTKQLISYMSSVNSLPLSIFGLASIYDNMFFESSTMISLVFALKKLMSESRYSELSLLAKSECESLKNKLPAPLVRLAFSSRLCMTSDYFNEYLSVTDDTRTSPTVFTRTFIDERYHWNEKFKWTFERVENDIFYIKKIPQSEYLCVSGTNEREVFVSMNVLAYNSTTATWQVICDQDTQDSIYLKSAFTKEFLTADTTHISLGSYGELRHVITVSTKKPTPKEKWKVLNCPQ